MKKIIFIIVFISFNANSQQTNDSVSVFDKKYQYQVLQDVNLREKSSAKSEIIRVLKQQEVIEIIDSTNNWYLIKDVNLKEGFVEINHRYSDTHKMSYTGIWQCEEY